MPVANLRGVDLYYEVEGAGDWVVFAHGGEGVHLNWWKQVAALRGRYRCVTYDARGFGLSGGGWGDPEETAADDLKGLLDHLGVDHAFLVGQSMGGIAVSGMAQRFPDRVRGLVMADTPFGFKTAALSQWAAEMLEKIPAGFNVFDHLFGPGFATEQPEMHYLCTAISRLNSTRPLPEDTGDYAQSYIRMRDTPPGDYSGFAVPSLFIVGDHDELTLPWLMEATAKAVAGSRFVIIPDAGHSAYFERSDRFNATVTAFFEQVKSRNAAGSRDSP